MHKRNLKRNTLIQGIKTSENSTKLTDYIDNQNESSNDFQLPRLQKKTVWKDVDDKVSAWDEHSSTDIFCSPEIENVATRKVMQQWEAVENTLYEDGEQVTQTAVLEECIQWRTQIPHLRVIGKNPFLAPETSRQDFSINFNEMNSFDCHNEDTFSEHSLSLKGRKSSAKQKLHKTQQEEIFEMLYQYVISELFPNKENDVDSLRNNFNDTLHIRMAHIHSNKSSAKSTKVNWLEEIIPLDNRFPNDKTVEDGSTLMRRRSIQTSSQLIQNEYNNPTYSGRMRKENDESTMDKLCRPHTSRNKLGTVFNEKVVVSPVPYVLSTRESFSTVKTTPIKLMTEALDTSTVPGSSRNINYFKNLGKNSTSATISNYQSAWHAPVSPAVWPKNIKLAPIDTSRLLKSKNRFLTSSSVTLPRSRKPLSPISRPVLPASAQTSNNQNEELEIQGRHISPGQSPKLNMSAIGWNNAGTSKNKKKRSQSKVKS